MQTLSFATCPKPLLELIHGVKGKGDHTVGLDGEKSPVSTVRCMEEGRRDPLTPSRVTVGFVGW